MYISFSFRKTRDRKSFSQDTEMTWIKNISESHEDAAVEAQNHDHAVQLAAAGEGGGQEEGAGGRRDPLRHRDAIRVSAGDGRSR